MSFSGINMSEKTVVKVEDLRKIFVLRGSFLNLLRGQKVMVKAVDGISFEIKQGETLSLVGESGSGKTTVGRLILKLIPSTSGKIFFNDINVDTLRKEDELRFRREAQIILQDPFGSLNPKMTVYNLIGESIDVHKLAKNKTDKDEMIIQAMKNLDLEPYEDIINKYPNELSGGQMQRVAIARTLVLNPKFIVADEPVSMLDASIKANMLNILIDIREKFNLSQLFITHDIAVAKYISHKIAVMYLGKIVETGSTDKVINEPLHPYTHALFSAVPSINPDIKRNEVKIIGEIPDAIILPSGCRFHPRCPIAQDICRSKEPKLELKHGHNVACHFV